MDGVINKTRLTVKKFKDSNRNEIHRDDKRRRNEMTKATIQPFWNAYKMNIGYFNGNEVCPKSVIEKDEAVFPYNDLFSLIWKTGGVSVDEAIEKCKWKFTFINI